MREEIANEQIERELYVNRRKSDWWLMIHDILCRYDIAFFCVELTTLVILLLSNGRMYW
jgi:2-iminoacetate synthase ThiH